MRQEDKRVAALELLLLVLTDDPDELATRRYGERQQLDKIRTRLGVSEHEQEHIVKLLFPASLAHSGASALLRGLPAFRGLLWLEARGGHEGGSGVTAAALDNFAGRQRTLLLAAASAGSGAASTRQAVAPEDVEKTLLEGWLEKRADNHLFKPWIRRYVRLLPGRLCWAHDEEGTKARELRLDVRTVATVEPDLTLRIVCEERTVALRLCAAGDESVGASCLGTAAEDIIDEPKVEEGVSAEGAEAARRENARRRRGEVTESLPSGRGGPTLQDWAQKIEGAA